MSFDNCVESCVHHHKVQNSFIVPHNCLIPLFFFYQPLSLLPLNPWQPVILFSSLSFCLFQNVTQIQSQSMQPFESAFFPLSMMHLRCSSMLPCVPLECLRQYPNRHWWSRPGSVFSLEVGEDFARQGMLDNRRRYFWLPSQELSRVLAPSGERPGMLLNIVRCTGQRPPAPSQRTFWSKMPIVQTVRSLVWSTVLASGFWKDFCVNQGCEPLV